MTKTLRDLAAGGWRRPEVLLILLAAAMPLSFQTWMALLNNFAIQRADFDGADIGILQSLREIPGFMSFAVVWILLLMREQVLAYVSLLLLGLGTALTGFFPSMTGLLVTTFIMSTGFHYYETVNQSLALQWVSKDKAPETLGRMISARSAAGILTLGLIWGGVHFAGLDFAIVYVIGGMATVAVAALAWFAWPSYAEDVVQHKHMVLRSRYWLYYLLTFFAGARRQIFVVFAGFLMVEKFGYDVSAITLLLLVNAVINTWAAPKIGRLIHRWGERKALVFEYVGLIGVFTAYAFVTDPWVAAGLYVVDHLFFAMAIAMKTYFQKIADPADMASTAGVSFTINHIGAVFIPVLYGLLWLYSPALVFLSGAAMAGCSLLLSINIPRDPRPGNEVILGPRMAPTPAPAGGAAAAE
ncbi:MAG: MFS transporter [Acetobacterales bacterium]